MSLVLLVEESEVPKETPLSPLTTSQGTYKNLWRVCIWACFGALSGVPLGPLGQQKQWEGLLRSHLGPILKGAKNDSKRKKVMEGSLLGHLRLDARSQQKASYHLSCSL